MKYHVMTLFPDMIKQGMDTSILKRAQEKGLIELNAVNIRDYTLERHGKVDDYPYGGGAGMVMQAEPIFRCYQAICGKQDLSLEFQKNTNMPKSQKSPRVIYLTPQGEVFNQRLAEEYSKEDELIFLCGHYEGVDERVLEEIVTDHVSIGDYVLTGGELPAMVIMDAVTRLVPGVLNNEDSAVTESFGEEGLLEYPQYTRPEEILGKKVPEVLLSGHHAKVEKWRHEQAVERTRLRRPDLYKKYLAKQSDL